ncbi:MAG: hypothetical protein AB7S75_24520 [Desulfococcaceae bacterium]
MSEEISESDIFARIYPHFCQQSFTAEECKKFRVKGLTGPVADRLVRTLKNSPRFPKVLLMGQGGCGTSDVLRQVSENKDLKKKRNVILFSLSDEICLADAQSSDILFAIYSRIIRSMPAEDLSAPLDDLRELTEPVFDNAGIKEKDITLTDAVSFRIRTDAAFRQSLREKLKARSEDLRRYTEKLCRNFSRTTYDCFRLSDSTFARLREEDVSDNILSKLEGIRDREYKSELRFLKSIEEKIGEVQALHYKDRILRHAWTEEPADLLILIDDGDKLEPRAAEKIFLEEFSDLMMPGAGILFTAPLHIFHSPLFSHVKKDIAVETIRPLRISDSAGNPDISSLALLREMVRKRISGVLDGSSEPAAAEVHNLPLTEEALVCLIVQSGGVLRDLNTLIRTGCKIAVSEKKEQMDEKTAGLAVTEMADTFMRFFDFEEYGDTVKKIIRTKNMKGTGSKTLGYLLKYRFVLEYGSGDEPQQSDAHPWLKEALNRIS